MPTSRSGTTGVAAPYRLLEIGMAPGWLNVGPTERWLSAIAGAVTASVGLRRRGGPGWLLAFLGGALIARGAIGHSPLYKWLGKRRGGRPASGVSAGTVLVERSVTIDRPAADLYAFWRRFENLPTVMHHLKSITTLGEGITRWVAAGPAGADVTWDAQLVDDEANELIAWRSLAGSQVHHAGSVRFRPAPAGRGTEVSVRLQALTPGGKAGTLVAAMFGASPKQEISDDLRRFKALMETGEILTTQGQASCRQ